MIEKRLRPPISEAMPRNMSVVSATYRIGHYPRMRFAAPAAFKRSQEVLNKRDTSWSPCFSKHIGTSIFYCIICSPFSCPLEAMPHNRACLACEEFHQLPTKEPYESKLRGFNISWNLWSSWSFPGSSWSCTCIISIVPRRLPLLEHRTPAEGPTSLFIQGHSMFREVDFDFPRPSGNFQLCTVNEHMEISRMDLSMQWKLDRI
jgi:hypothetical protein